MNALSERDRHAVLVTGGRGFIGACFVRYLIVEYSVLVLLWFLGGLVVMVRDTPPREGCVAGSVGEPTIDELPWFASRRSRHATSVRAG